MCVCVCVCVYIYKHIGLEDIELAVEAHYHDLPRLLCSHPPDWLRDRYVLYT